MRNRRIVLRAGIRLLNIVLALYILPSCVKQCSIGISGTLVIILPIVRFPKRTLQIYQMYVFLKQSNFDCINKMCIIIVISTSGPVGKVLKDPPSKETTFKKDAIAIQVILIIQIHGFLILF